MRYENENDICVVCGRYLETNHKCPENVAKSIDRIYLCEPKIEERRWSDRQRLDYGFQLLDLHREGVLSDQDEEFDEKE